MSGSIRVPPGGRWYCDPKCPPFVVDGVAFCPTCGRLIRERFRTRPSHPIPEYVRVHISRWGFWGAC